MVAGIFMQFSAPPYFNNSIFIKNRDRTVCGLCVFSCLFNFGTCFLVTVCSLHEEYQMKIYSFHLYC